MTNNKLTEWLKNWKRNLLELFVIAGILASAFTTYTGAYQLVNRSVPVALLFTAFFQGGIYVVGHYTSVTEPERERRRTFTLCLVWAVLAFFSVYASSLGMFDIQQESLRSDRSRVNVFRQWTDAAKALAEFKTRGLAEIEGWGEYRDRPRIPPTEETVREVGVTLIFSDPSRARAGLVARQCFEHSSMLSEALGLIRAPRSSSLPPLCLLLASCCRPSLSCSFQSLP